MFFKKKTPIERIIKLKARNDLKGISNILQETAMSEGYSSQVIDELASFIATSKLPFYNFLIEFVNRNPNKLTGVQLRVAEVYAEQGNEDECTVEARIFLKKLFAISGQNSERTRPDLSVMGLRGYLLLTAVFTKVGARSYSLSVLKDALIRCKTEEGNKQFIHIEIENLNRELAEPVNADMDSKWRDFFSTGKNFQEIYDFCKLLKCDNLAKRVDIIESNFRFNPAYKMDSSEILMEIYQNLSSDGTSIFILK